MVLRTKEQALDSAIVGHKPPALGTQLTAADCCELARMVAYAGIGHVSPNPLVGAVIVDSANKLLGYGAHQQVGDHHAEINALAGLAEGACRGASIYITLEPCSVAGRTPACAPRLVREGFAKVFLGAIDPHPEVNGRGVAMLREAGVAVEMVESWRPDCERLAEIFRLNCSSLRPFVALKIAAGLDGNIARQGDRRRWLTGERARSYGHFLRSYYDGILVGAATVREDNPRLDARNTIARRRDPVPIVLDPRASLGDIDLQLLRPEAKTIVIVGEEYKERIPQHYQGVKVCTVPLQRDILQPKDVLTCLYREGIRSVMVEGGALTVSHFLDAGYADKLHLFQASSVLCGPNVLNWTGSARGESDFAFVDPELTLLGDDWVIEGKLQKEST